METTQGPILLTTAAPGSKEWLAARAGKITASTAASILAPGELGAYGTPLTEYTRIKAEIEGKALAELPEDLDADDDDEERDEPVQDERADFAWGNATEDLHRKMLARLCGMDITAAPGVFQDAELPWLGATPDGYLMRDRQIVGLVEMKAPTNFGMHKWRDGTPLGYVIQANVQMRVMQLPEDIVSAIIPPRPRWQRVFKSPEMQEWILEGLTTFWTHNIMCDIPPSPSGNEKDLRALRLLYPQSTGRRIVFSVTANEAAKRLKAAKAAIKAAEDEASECKALIMAELADAEAGVLQDGTGYTFKTSVVNTKAKEATTRTQRTLREAKNLQ